MHAMATPFNHRQNAEIEEIRLALKDALALATNASQASHVFERMGRVETDLKEVDKKLTKIEMYIDKEEESRLRRRWILGLIMTSLLGVVGYMAEKIDRVDIKLDQHFVQMDGD